MADEREAQALAGQSTTDDAVLGGRLRLRQLRRGHRVGHDAILLAAAIPAQAGEHVVDLGAGIGSAGLAIASRVPGLSVTFVEIDRQLIELCTENIAVNGFAGSARAMVLDVEAPAASFEAAGLAAGSAARVLMNPPFNDPARQQASPDQLRSRAHMAEGEGLAAWVRCAQRLLAANGTLTLIWRAQALAQVLDVLSIGFGAIAVLPIYPKPDVAAIRVLVNAVKGSRAPLTLCPPLVLADANGHPTPQAEAVLRDAAPLMLAD